MATATLNPAINSISGTIGGIVLYKRYGRTIMRSYIIPPNPCTPAQQANRSRFRDAMLSWRQLPDEEKDSFNRMARRLGMTGHNLYISRYMKGTIVQNREYTATDEGLPADFALNNEFAAGNKAPGKFALSKKFSARDDFALSSAVAHGRINLNCGFALSKEPAPDNYFTPCNALDTLFSPYRSVTAPSAQARRVFSHPAGGL